jgi:hypothetical protein
MEYRQRDDTEDDLIFLIANLAASERWLAGLDATSIPSVDELKEAVMTAHAAAHRALAELRLAAGKRLRPH